MKKEEFISKYGIEAYEKQHLNRKEYFKEYRLKNRGCKPNFDFSDCVTKYDRMKKMNLFVEYSAPKVELMPEVSGKIDIFQIGDCKDRIYLTPYMKNNGRYEVYAFDKESGKQYHIKVHQVVYFAEFGNIPDGWDIHHIDGNKLNNHPCNLIALPHDEHIRFHRLKDRNKANEIMNKYRRVQRMWQ